MLGQVYDVSGETANVKDCSGEEHDVPVHALIQAGTAEKDRFNQARKAEETRIKEAHSMQRAAPDTERAFETPPKFTSTRTNLSEDIKAALDRFEAEEYQIALAMSLSEVVAPDTERTVETPKRFTSRGTNVSEGTKDPLRQVDAFEAKEAASEAVAPDTEQIVETPIGFTTTGTNLSEGTKKALRQVDTFEAKRSGTQKKRSVVAKNAP
jgi:hypothetical protein